MSLTFSMEVRDGRTGWGAADTRDTPKTANKAKAAKRRRIMSDRGDMIIGNIYICLVSLRATIKSPSSDREVGCGAKNIGSRAQAAT